MPIRVLAADTVAGISAGEVIDRPASVVKELVENALDAGAKRVTIELEGAGLKLIRVTDDGCGLPAEEALLAFSRHATSKLVRLGDLDRLTTYGFRGEALAAVAAAGGIELLSRVNGATEGVRVAGGGGAPLEVRPAGCDLGTTIAVRRLFASMPARLKFLRSPAAEAAAIARALEPYALMRPDVHFRLVTDGRDRLNAPPARDALARVRIVVGDAGASLVPFDLAEAAVRVRGFAEPPGSVARRGRQWFLVNTRPVEDRMIRHAVISAYAGQLPREAAPTAVVWLDVAPDRVDVNVHPAKAQVRFADAQDVYRAVHRALRNAFAAPTVPAGGDSRASTTVPSPGDGVGIASAGGGWTAEPSADWGATEPLPAGEVEVLGQLYRTYIVARLPDGLMLVDQHTAHEKIIFERLQARRDDRASQGLLLPRQLEFAASEAVLLRDQEPALRSLGFDLAPFGGNAFVVHAVPAEAGDHDLGPLLRWLLEDLEQAGRMTTREELDKKLAATMACHLAVKAGDRLDRREMDAIVRGLLGLSDPRSCPHGRPTFLKYEEGDLARLFQRTWGLGKRECH